MSAKSGKRPSIFWSHSNKDSKLVKAIVSLIKGKLKGIEHYLSEEDCQVGHIPKKIMRKIDNSICVVAVLTPNGMSSAWVLNEIGYAKGRRKLVIPLTEKYEYITGLIEGIEGHLINPNNPSANIEKLIDYLSIFAKIQPTPRKITEQGECPSINITELMRDHKFPDYIVRSCSSCYIFGSIFVLFGEPGIILPVNKYIDIGVRSGAGEVIDWSGRTKNGLVPKYGRHKDSFTKLVNGDTPLIDSFDLYKGLNVFDDENHYRSYFAALSKYDYTLIADSGCGRGLSTAGAVATILATIAIKTVDKRMPPFIKLYQKNKAQQWVLDKKETDYKINPQKISEVIKKLENDDVILFKRFLKLSQIFERHWNFPFDYKKREDIEHFQKLFQMREFSSGGASLSSTFGFPMKVQLSETGHIDIESDYSSEILPNLQYGPYLKLIIDHGGYPDNPESTFLKSVKRMNTLLPASGERSAGTQIIPFFGNLKNMSGSLVETSKNILLQDIKNVSTRKMLRVAMEMQKGIYNSLGIENRILNYELQPLLAPFSVGVNPIGVGDGGTYICILEHKGAEKQFRKVLQTLSQSRGTKIEIINHNRENCIFSGHPLSLFEN